MFEQILLAQTRQELLLCRRMLLQFATGAVRQAIITLAELAEVDLLDAYLDAEPEQATRLGKLLEHQGEP